MPRSSLRSPLLPLFLALGLVGCGAPLARQVLVREPAPAERADAAATSSASATDLPPDDAGTAPATDASSPEPPDEPPSPPGGAVEGDATTGEEPASTETPSTPEPEGDDDDPGRIVLDTVYDDARVGNDQTDDVEAEMGLVRDEALNEYVRSVAFRLLRHTPSRPFDWEFQIVDQTVPNAFALPGGKIYVSRGLLALVGSEDELAAVLGHEITHAAERHAAARVDYASRLNPLSIGYQRAASIAAYGREQERDADRGGQLLCARAGYDPNGIATFLRKLDAAERYEVGWSRLPSFFATHPTSPERAALASNRAAGLDWRPIQGVAGDLLYGYLSAVEGLVLGDDPAGGVFDGPRFVHPEMRFSIRFPQGWDTLNTQQAVLAASPLRDAQASLTVEGGNEPLDTVVDRFLENEAEDLRVRVRQSILLGDRPAIRLEGRAVSGGVPITAQMTFVAHEGLVFRLSMLSIAGVAGDYRGRARAFAQSFRPLDDESAHALSVVRLRIARALGNESLEALSERTHNALEVVYTGLMNGLYADSVPPRGTPIKIGLEEPYVPAPRPDPAPTGPVD
ncbi:MAG: M48 family metalloprotease [Spirochaetaceae bacterium]|nr:M48 family metalloprotease [Spirochaetaceae bacterium]HPG25186.1 M48 family metalloprotease [Myxococcota bacterium]